MNDVYFKITIYRNYPRKKIMEQEIYFSEHLSEKFLSGADDAREYLYNQFVKENALKIEGLIKSIVSFSKESDLLFEYELNQPKLAPKEFTQLLIKCNGKDWDIKNQVKWKLQGAISGHTNSREIFIDRRSLNREYDNIFSDQIKIIEEIVEPEINIIEDNFHEDDLMGIEVNTNIPESEKDNTPAHELSHSERAQPIPFNKDKEEPPREDPIIFDVQEKQDHPTSKLQPKVCVRRAALDQARKHAKAEIQVETGGVLLGHFLKEDEKTIVVVTGIVRALYTEQRAASLTFTPKTWAQILYWMDNDPIYADDKTWSMVGWYHTHPNFGIFLSSHDLSIHKNHFQRPEHIALVIDPKREEEGVFSWNTAHTEVFEMKALRSGRHLMTKDDGEIRRLLKHLNLKELPAPEVFEPKKKG